MSGGGGCFFGRFEANNEKLKQGTRSKVIRKAFEDKSMGNGVFTGNFGNIRA